MLQSRLARPSFWLSVVLGLALAGALAILAQDFLRGGNDWKQADWLINAEGVFVRRGLLGSLIIRGSDLVAVSPLLATIALQAILVVVTAWLTWAACIRQGVTAKLLLVVVSASFFLIFWTADWQGAFRKELLVYLALAILAYGATLPVMPRWQQIGSACVFVAAIITHEGLIFFLPLYLAALHFSGVKLLARETWGVTALLLLAVAAAFLFNLLQPRLENMGPVCQPLLDRGFTDPFCGGAIDALTHSLAFEMGQTAGLFTIRGAVKVAYAYCLCLIPFCIYAVDGRNTNWRLLGMVLAAGLPFLPLYLVAYDWGRWISFHMTGAVYLLLIQRARGLAPESARQWPIPVLVAIGLLPWLLAFNHAGASPQRGVITFITGKALMQILH